MCEKAVGKYPWSLEYVSDNLKTQEMCNEAVVKYTQAIEFVPVHLRTQEMFKKQLRNTHRA